MKWNWGTGLFVFFVLFVGILAFVLYQSTQVDNALVMDNYYEEDLNYQSHYEKKQNTASLSDKVLVSYDHEKNELRLKFPDTIAAESGIAGNVWLYRPSDKGQDIHHDFQLLNELEWTKQIGKLENGRWKVKIDWKAGSRSYFQEEEIIL